ncbi:MAG: Fe-S cluster assembly ATPase SufC [Acidimicrobiia bacterium]|nr:Fe-S cluster assembly ATPase SufC [Acidimicrobiia bacterium]
MTAPALQIRDLHASVGELSILNGVDLDVPAGEVHVLMGPNGSGKSTLCHVLMGKDEYTATGSALVNGAEIMGLSVTDRARAGLFEAFQYPTVIPGVSLDQLTDEMEAAADDGEAFRARVESASDHLGMDRFRDRPVNDGLSGGEKKRSEMYQLAVANPRVAVLDEVDSGLDVDAVREVAELVEELRSPDLGVLLITHYSRILRYMKPDRIHVMVAGKIVRSGGPEVADQLEDEGYDTLRGSDQPDQDDPLLDLL